VRLSALSAGRPLPPRKIPGTHFCERLSRPQGHNAAGSIRSIEKSNDLIGNRTRDLPACSVVAQPITPLVATSKLLIAPLNKVQIRNKIWSLDVDTRVFTESGMKLTR
jgi:hypothetical protein